MGQTPSWANTCAYGGDQPLGGDIQGAFRIASIALIYIGKTSGTRERKPTNAWMERLGSRPHNDINLTMLKQSRFVSS